MSNRRLFDSPIPWDLEQDLRSLNPQWENKPGISLPAFRRALFLRNKHLLTSGLTPALVLRGPRRVGKTVLMRQIIEDLLKEGVNPSHVLYVPFDEITNLQKISDPVLAIARWFERFVIKRTFNEIAQGRSTAYIFFDEVQNLEAWAPQVKHLVDNHNIRIMVTGSSSLRIEAGRDSLAGRITTMDLGPLLLREIAELRFSPPQKPIWGENALDKLLSLEFWKDAAKRTQQERDLRLKAFAAFSERGAYPIAQQRYETPWPEMADHLSETVIKRAIQHDLRMGPRGQKRDEKLLEEVFRLCCRYAGQTPGQAVFVPEIQQALAGNIGWNRILNYLRFLDGSLLIRLVQPIELRLKKKKAPAKVCLCDHSLRAGWLQEIVPLDSELLSKNLHLSDLAGHLAESTLGYFLASIPNLDIAHFPSRGAEPEVDFILTIGIHRIPIEVKYRRRIDPHEDTRGIRAFLEKTVYNAPFGILVTMDDDVLIPDPRIVSMSLSSFLWLR